MEGAFLSCCFFVPVFLNGRGASPPYILSFSHLYREVWKPEADVHCASQGRIQGVGVGVRAGVCVCSYGLVHTRASGPLSEEVGLRHRSVVVMKKAFRTETSACPGNFTGFCVLPEDILHIKGPVIF